MTTPDTASPPLSPNQGGAGLSGRGDLLPVPRKLSIGSGFSWFSGGFDLYRPEVFTFVLMTVVWFVVNVPLNFLPFLAQILGPVFLAGWMMAARSVDVGERATVEQLFGGFQYRFGSLLLVGIIPLAATLGILVLTMLAFGLSLTLPGWDFMERGLTRFDPMNMPDIPAEMLAGVLLTALVVLGLVTLLMMAVWFAPALVVFHELSAMDAMALSLRGCLANTWPFLSYGLLFLVLAVLATIPLGTGWLILFPVLMTSTYVAYRDIFTVR